MALTVFTITGVLSMAAITASILTGHYAGRRGDIAVSESLILSAVIIPFLIAFLSLPLYNIVPNDWPSSPYLLPPQLLIFLASLFGGFLGYKSGEIWNQGEASCIRCLLSLVTVLTLLSLVIVLIP